MSYPLSTATPPPSGYTRNIIYLGWEQEFLPWLTGRMRRTSRDGATIPLAGPWKPGMHVALIGKTGEGKSTMAVGMMDTRKYVLALDPKGEDDTLEAAGYTRVTGLPPKKRLPKEVQEDLDAGRPVRLVVGGGSRTRDDDAKLRELLEDALEYARQSGGWTLYVDEYQLLADQRMYRLGPNVERLLISARRYKTSVVTAFQAPAWVPKAATRQSSIIVAWRTRDKDMMQNIARTSGRDWRQIGEAMDELPKFHVLVIPDELRAPMMITSAPKIN
jgi:hypothetical protein